MQITFDPLVPAEVEAVCQFINRASEVAMIPSSPAVRVAQLRKEISEHLAEDAGTGSGGTGTPVLSAGPLEPDAPLPAAADLFATAPVAPPAGEASAPIVPPPHVPAAPAPAYAPTAHALPVIPADSVDVHGLPWDARIHSGTKVKNQDGSWRQRRGLNDPDLVKRVEGELRALMAIPTPGAVSAGPLAMTPTDAKAATAPAAPTPEGPAANATALAAIPAPANGSTPVPPALDPSGNVPPPPVPAPPTSAPAIAPIPSPPVPPAPTAAASTAPPTFAQFMRKVSDGIAQSKITEAQVHEALALVGLGPTQIGGLAARADLIPPVAAHIDALLGNGGV